MNYYVAVTNFHALSMLDKLYLTWLPSHTHDLLIPYLKHEKSDKYLTLLKEIHQISKKEIEEPVGEINHTEFICKLQAIEISSSELGLSYQDSKKIIVAMLLASEPKNYWAICHMALCYSSAFPENKDEYADLLKRNNTIYAYGALDENIINQILLYPPTRTDRSR